VDEGVPPALAARLRGEPWAAALGVEYLELARGRCRVALRLGPEMVNHQGQPHGGVLVSLADIAFGAACNSHGPEAVAVSMTVDFLAPAPPGARLIADCRVLRQGRRTGFYTVSVAVDGGPVVARLSCLSHRRGAGDGRAGGGSVSEAESQAS
jgi:acyl-CoA thioesterase